MYPTGVKFDPFGLPPPKSPFGELTRARCAAWRKFYPLGRNIATPNVGFHVKPRLSTPSSSLQNKINGGAYGDGIPENCRPLSVGLVRRAGAGGLPRGPVWNLDVHLLRSWKVRSIMSCVCISARQLPAVPAMVLEVRRDCVVALGVD